MKFVDGEEVIDVEEPKEVKKSSNFKEELKKYQVIQDLDGEYYRNLAKELSQADMDRISTDIVSGYEQDNNSLSRLREVREEYRRYTSLSPSSGGKSESGVAKVSAPHISTPCRQFASRAFSNLTNNDAKLVNMKAIQEFQPMQDKDGNEISAEEQEKATIDEVEKDFNAGLFADTSFLPSLRKTLVQLPEDGYAFRKIYFDKKLQIGRSDVCNAEDLVVPYGTRDINTCPRITYLNRMNQIELEELSKGNYGFLRHKEVYEENQFELDSEERDKVVLDESKGIEPPEHGDYTTPQIVLEQHTYVDLDGKGHREWCVAYVHHATGKLLCLKRNTYPVTTVNEYGESETVHQRMTDFVAYEFFERADTIFGDGFGLNLLQYQKAMDALLDQVIQGVIADSAPRGFIKDTSKVPRGDQEFKPYEFKEIKIPRGEKLSDSIYVLPSPNAGNAAIQLMDHVKAQIDRYTTVNDLSTGAVPRSDTTTGAHQMAMEMNMKPFTEMQKSFHRVFKVELEKRMLKIALFATNDPSRREMYIQALGVLDVVPVSDPNISSEQQEFQKAQMLTEQVKADPVLANSKKALELAFRKSIETSQESDVVNKMMAIYANESELQSELEIQLQEVTQQLQQLAQENAALQEALSGSQQQVESTQKGLDEMAKLAQEGGESK